MRDIRGYEVHEVETTSNRSKLLGAAVVALGIGALGVYAFASGDSRSAPLQQLASNQIRTTPEGAQQMPPPVTPPLTENPVDPITPSKPQAGSQQAAVKPKAPMAAPAPEITPPENAQPVQSTQPAAVPEQPAPQETPAPTENPVPPQSQ